MKLHKLPDPVYLPCWWVWDWINRLKDSDTARADSVESKAASRKT